MDVKEPKKIIRNLFTKYAIIQDNVVYAEKLFIINTVINYIFKDEDYRTIKKTTLLHYGELINKFIKNEVDIYWEDDKLFVEELDSVGKQINGE